MDDPIRLPVLPEGVWRWAQADVPLVRDQDWHLTSDGEKTFCSRDVRAGSLVGLGEFVPMRRDLTCAQKAKALLGIS